MTEIRTFSLVGGTALSLMYGHCTVVGLDLFSITPFGNKKIAQTLKTKFKYFFIREGICKYSTKVITAMKVKAILGRDNKKYIWGVAEWLVHFTVADFIKFYKEKYTTQNLLICGPHALNYFVNTEDGEEPISFKKQTWPEVKKTMNG